MTVVEVADYREAIGFVTEHSGIVVVIVPHRSLGLPEAYAEALRRNSGVRFLTIAATADRADLFEVRLLGSDVGRQGVVDAIKVAIASPPPTLLPP